MKDTGKIAYFVMVALVLALFAAPLAHAESSLFIGSKKNKSSVNKSSVENKKPSLFVRPGDKRKSTHKKPFVGKNTFRSDPRLKIYKGTRKSGKKLVMGNMDMRGNKTPTKEDLMMMVRANRQGDFEIMQKRSALIRQRVERNRKGLRDKRQNTKRTRKVAIFNKKAKSKKKVKVVKNRRRVFIRRKDSKPGKALRKTRRVFNAYD